MSDTHHLPRSMMFTISRRTRDLSILLTFVIISLISSYHAFNYRSHADVPPISTRPSLPADNAPSNHSTHTITPFTKRAVSAEYQCLAKKGREYWETGALPAFAGQSRFTTPNFGPDRETALKESGWTSFEQPKMLPEQWNDAFKSTKGKVPKSDVREFFLDQSHDFTNDEGEQMATSGYYHGYFIPENDAVIVYAARSPQNRVSVRRGVKKEDIPKLIPRMHQMSDLLWYAWTGVTADAKSLRYYALQGLADQGEKALIYEIFQVRRKTTKVPWKKRVTFDLTSDEGRALFGTPNGVALAWLLIHHGAVLGKREPRVTIFSDPNENLCLIWDLIPAGQKGSFGKVEKGTKSSRKAM